MTQLKLFLKILIVIVLIIIAFTILQTSFRASDVISDENINENESNIACTMDAMQCPDGSYVGRSGPKCQFVCPK